MGRLCSWRTRSRKPVLLLSLLALLLLVLPSCEATRGMQPFRGRPVERGGANHFLGFLPRGQMPPSGPSRQHNSVGLESQLENKP
ncbi:protein IDA-LIKE 2 [Brachypodium distachyon]|uniref:Protein IDA-LIKE 2 n=1 Tax=Brachypodium distachyon TaxID=15368 RepID=A0A2K2CGA1_BRADI|nr:protein IDA-LIKE 2 [Brachypodium distachyon]PNT61055.1 hypothetical protein BRADI_5g09757v3 [Brachypodium distachyon]|eukprot:XP_024311269.1 protein IDA-LIKE 2 [Brachypodium distachyon]